MQVHEVPIFQPPVQETWQGVNTVFHRKLVRATTAFSHPDATLGPHMEGSDPNPLEGSGVSNLRDQGLFGASGQDDHRRARTRRLKPVHPSHRERIGGVVPRV